MLQIVAIPVHDNDSTPGPWYSTMAPVPPLTVIMPATFRMTTRAPLGVVQPPILPVRFTPMTLGHFNSQGISAMTSTASAPPTPQATIPKPPAFGV
ncbi:uncharacterized protein F5891DRAFT_1232795 [Suillus fuscotomentosus]|uniref:Uncharacterized protein n=1 Tax=Suillus fuscotomentosus TaxID=1912939 RepID=A0AAD4E778_9AGAM|nr:uncharacterized protein F5891DRAFT_1232795 [Suillus fuscotomentosus]KAG1899719.1 hypothetical protein F5891DRAFT_1232795 [Suillus fuscotomentosus]